MRRVSCAAFSPCIQVEQLRKLNTELRERGVRIHKHDSQTHDECSIHPHDVFTL